MSRRHLGCRLLTAAERLFGEGEDPDRVSMDDIAAAAGVGKGTLLCRFGDRVGLIKALVEQRTEQLRAEVATGPPPLGPGAPAEQRALALLDALLRLKLDTRPLMLALESAGSGSPYRNETYALWHAEPTALLTEARGERHADFLAHALLARTQRLDRAPPRERHPGAAHPRRRGRPRPRDPDGRRPT
ncbi:TetR/AcrR family transcriptional regulator [Streptomyces sp. NPDC018059]|uniref:TetR/AcrR family transcriptional regulator n=1 Tax=Streptomyces sp. NPDC018059 TaxID=3365041 RepID=UPI00379E7A13